MLTTNKQQFLDWLVECGNDLLAIKVGGDLILSICGNSGPIIAETGIIYEDENGEVCVARFGSALDIEKFLQENGYYSNGVTVTNKDNVQAYSAPSKSFINWLKDKKSEEPQFDFLNRLKESTQEIRELLKKIPDPGNSGFVTVERGIAVPTRYKLRMFSMFVRAARCFFKKQPTKVTEESKNRINYYYTNLDKKSQSFFLMMETGGVDGKIIVEAEDYRKLMEIFSHEF